MHPQLTTTLSLCSAGAQSQGAVNDSQVLSLLLPTELHPQSYHTTLLRGRENSRTIHSNLREKSQHRQVVTPNRHWEEGEEEKQKKKEKQEEEEGEEG